MIKINNIIASLISYFFVGLSAALVEWTTFWVCNGLLKRDIYLSTVIAFVLATLVNWILGRRFTFRKSESAQKPGWDAIAVYIVSGIGLGFNLLLMTLFVVKIGIPSLLSKIFSTGTVFLWNFVSRRFIIYKQES